jgi:hypothetical protein
VVTARFWHTRRAGYVWSIRRGWPFATAWLLNLVSADIDLAVNHPWIACEVDGADHGR